MTPLDMSQSAILLGTRRERTKDVQPGATFAKTSIPALRVPFRQRRVWRTNRFIRQRPVRTTAGQGYATESKGARALIVGAFSRAERRPTKSRRRCCASPDAELKRVAASPGCQLDEGSSRRRDQPVPQRRSGTVPVRSPPDGGQGRPGRRGATGLPTHLVRRSQ